MKLYQKIIEGSKTHVYILGFPVYYENIKDNETRKRFLWMHSVKKREVGIVQNGDKKSIFSKIINIFLPKFLFFFSSWSSYYS